MASRPVPRIRIPSRTIDEPATTRKKKCHEPAMAQRCPGAKPMVGSRWSSVVTEEICARVPPRTLIHCIIMHPVLVFKERVAKNFRRTSTLASFYVGNKFSNFLLSHRTEKSNSDRSRLLLFSAQIPNRIKFSHLARFLHTPVNGTILNLILFNHRSVAK